MQQFIDYTLVHKFLHGNKPLKSWITHKNYINVYKQDIETTFDLLDELKNAHEGISYVISHRSDDRPQISITYKDVKTVTHYGNNRPLIIYNACVEMLRYCYDHEILLKH